MQPEEIQDRMAPSELRAQHVEYSMRRAQGNSGLQCASDRRSLGQPWYGHG